MRLALLVRNGLPSAAQLDELGTGGGAPDGPDASLEAFEVGADADEALGEPKFSLDDVPAAGDVGGFEVVETSERR